MEVIARHERIARLPFMRNRFFGIFACTRGAPHWSGRHRRAAGAGAAADLRGRRLRPVLRVQPLPGRTVSLCLAALSSLISLRYLYWRLTETLEFTTFWQTFLGTGLIFAEIYAVVALVLAYFQVAWPLDRKPVPLPDDPETWPSVDIFIPSYNESLEIVRPTVFAAMAIDWPQHKMNVYILDDGRRDDFRRFAEEVGCGYIIRPDNKGAKAGNINHALTVTDSEYVVIFDCDHVATRAFLQLTVGWMIRDRGLCMVQTPHHFYSPDPFERNLSSGQRVPNEGLLFYGLIQQGNDFWGPPSSAAPARCSGARRWRRWAACRPRR
jgi:cellulose synthase (UDP-forming)